jgi:hypothetical protein
MFFIISYSKIFGNTYITENSAEMSHITYCCRHKNADKRDGPPAVYSRSGGRGHSGSFLFRLRLQGNGLPAKGDVPMTQHFRAETVYTATVTLHAAMGYLCRDTGLAGGGPADIEPIPGVWVVTARGCSFFFGEGRRNTCRIQAPRRSYGINIF